MIGTLLGSNIAIVGGGRICKEILQTLSSENFRQKNFAILGVAGYRWPGYGAEICQATWGFYD